MDLTIIAQQNVKRPENDECPAKSSQCKNMRVDDKKETNIYVRRGRLCITETREAQGMHIHLIHNVVYTHIYLYMCVGEKTALPPVVSTNPVRRAKLR